MRTLIILYKIRRLASEMMKDKDIINNKNAFTKVEKLTKLVSEAINKTKI